MQQQQQPPAQNPGAPPPTNPSQPSPSAANLPYPVVNPAAPLYPGLGDYMGLELSEDVIRANMPEYLASTQVAVPQQVGHILAARITLRVYYNVTFIFKLV